ncbi:hypothetical protein FOZ60_009253 [Perkinsus olseni]|uniref:Uncharacterized protein n=1 Tax=Perkinsus olseni TaxID=32597 RepID=A0A7J6NHR1_PEROL|nr:hypothetical protein FOZ60_009253 [Perkinsus olseni]
MQTPSGHAYKIRIFTSCSVQRVTFGSPVHQHMKGVLRLICIITALTRLLYAVQLDVVGDPEHLPSVRRLFGGQCKDCPHTCTCSLYGVPCWCPHA